MSKVKLNLDLSFLNLSWDWISHQLIQVATLLFLKEKSKDSFFLIKNLYFFKLKECGRLDLQIEDYFQITLYI